MMVMRIGKIELGNSMSVPARIGPEQEFAAAARYAHHLFQHDRHADGGDQHGERALAGEREDDGPADDISDRSRAVTA